MGELVFQIDCLDHVLAVRGADRDATGGVVFSDRQRTVDDSPMRTQIQIGSGMAPHRFDFLISWESFSRFLDSVDWSER